MSELPDSIKEMLEKLQEMGPIHTLITRSLQAILQPDESILVHFHQLQSSETGNTFGSLDINMLTSSRFITLSFFPSYHQYDVKDVHKVAHFKMMNRFATGYEGEGDATTAEERGYNPLQTELTIQFADEHGQEVYVWNQEATNAEDVRALFKQLPMLSRITGKPLAHQKV